MPIIEEVDESTPANGQSSEGLRNGSSQSAPAGGSGVSSGGGTALSRVIVSK